MEAASSGNLKTQRYPQEKGAALVSTLMLSMLILAVGGALLISTTMTATNAYDSTAEMQAYYAAESGLNAALNVLRGNYDAASYPSPAVTNPSAPMNKMIENMLLASTVSTSNKPTDPINSVVVNGKTGIARLSRWLPYQGPLTASINTGTANRVVVDATLGTAYSVTVEDPDGKVPPNEPRRLIIASTGYGPKGAVKRMEMMVQRYSFSFNPKSTISLISAADGTPIPSFDVGDSNVKEYNGNDNYTGSKPPDWPYPTDLPVIGVTGAGDATLVQDNIDASQPDTVIPGDGEGQSELIPTADLDVWLRDVNKTRALVSRLSSIAQAEGRYFTSFPDGNAGTPTEPVLTFVNGDADLGPNFQGAGMLVVTGSATLKGSTDFYGLILVLGEGSYTQTGSGNGQILGGVVVAKFGATGNFQAPTFNVNGGGNGAKKYDSSWINRALRSPGPIVISIAEK